MTSSPWPRRSEAPLAQIAKDFGISESCLHRWVKRAEIEEGVREGLTQAEEAEIRELKKRNRLRSRRTRSFAGRLSTSGKGSTQRASGWSGLCVGPTAIRST